MSCVSCLISHFENFRDAEFRCGVGEFRMNGLTDREGESVFYLFQKGLSLRCDVASGFVKLLETGRSLRGLGDF